MQPPKARLTVAEIGQARDGLLGTPIDWPEASGADAAGIQLLVSAARSGHVIPDSLLFAEEVLQQAARLCLPWPPAPQADRVREAVQ